MIKIVTLTLSPALDKSSTVERMLPEHKLRCGPVREDAGGGGINVSKGIHRLGGHSVAVFPAGGHNGDVLCQILAKEGVETDVVKVAAETRENVAITETTTNMQYRFTFQGANIAEKEAQACLDKALSLKPDLLIASGSLPPGLPETWYAQVAAAARKQKVRLILDTSGAALQAAAQEGLFLLKPNLRELSALAGVKELEMNQVDDAALAIIERGHCEVVVVSLGAKGALLATKHGFEHIPAPVVQIRTTVGAGDSMVAGMAYALSTGKKFKSMVQWGVACGSAATINKGTELFHKEDAERMHQWIVKYGQRERFTDF